MKLKTEAVLQHQSTLFLVFSPKCPAYAELATWLHVSSKCPVKDFKVGLCSDLLDPHPTLIIPKGTLSDKKVVLKGKISILRYLARLSNSSLYGPGMDEWFDGYRQGNILKFESTQLSLVEFCKWDHYIASGHSECKASFDRLNGDYEKARQQIDELIQNTPLLDKVRFRIAEQVSKLLGVDQVYPVLEEPRDRQYGDVALPVPRLKLPGNPLEIAKKLTAEFKTDDLITSVSNIGPFVNFTFNKATYTNMISSILSQGTSYGTGTSGYGELAIVEFSSPNIAKPFHVGHLRSTIIGSFVQKALKASGHSTLSINYLGDWGKQYGLLAVGFTKYGSNEELEKDPIRHLYNVYVQINKDASDNPAIHDDARSYFKRMEDGDPEALALWQKFRDLSIVAYKDIYNRLNVTFDIYSGESQYSLLQMKDVLKELEDKGLLVPDQGALIVDLKSYKLGAALIGKTDGSMLYLSRDIAAAIDRKTKYDYDKMFYVVGGTQSHHFNQLFKILELMGYPWKVEHLGFGLIKSKDGNMSTRKGTVVFLQDILDEVKEEMHNVMKKNETKYAHIQDPERIADIVGISAISIQDMSARRIKDYEFDWSRMLSFEGDTGPYLQYAHSRLCSIERMSNLVVDPKEPVDFSLLQEPQALSLLSIMAEYPDVVKLISTSLEPCNLVVYALRLCHAVSSAYDVLWVANQEPPIAKARLAMYSAARITLGNALVLLGLTPVTRM